jgi:hypothetical protein
VALKDLEWRRNAARMVILIADAPPHGMCEASRSGEHANALIAQVSASGEIVSRHDCPMWSHLLISCIEIKTGDPEGHDPLIIARSMAQHGITLVSELPLSVAGLSSHIVVHGRMRGHFVKLHCELSLLVIVTLSALTCH